MIGDFVGTLATAPEASMALIQRIIAADAEDAAERA